MALELKTGEAQLVSTKDLNEHVMRLLADKPDPREADPKSRNFQLSRPPVND